MTNILFQGGFGEIGKRRWPVIQGPAGEVQQVEGIGSQRTWGATEQGLGIQKAVGPVDLLARLNEQAVRGRAVADRRLIGEGECHGRCAAFGPEATIFWRLSRVESWYQTC